MASKRMCFALAVLFLIAVQGPRRAYSQGGEAGTDMNALTSQAQNALDAKKWQEAIGPLQQLIAADPANWEHYQKLGGAQLNLGQYEEAIRTCEKGIEAARRALSGPAGQNAAEAEKTKRGMGVMLTQQGNGYLKLKKNDEAVAAYTKAAEISPNPGTAYFNICATLYNLGNMDGALKACEKCVSIDPTRADAYYVLGSALFSKGNTGPNNKYVVPPGTAEALKKYLELAPTGPHAKDVKEMLDMIAGK
jgi:tetratricopeptide (TPR) repeat protein